MQSTVRPMPDSKFIFQIQGRYHPFSSFLYALFFLLTICTLLPHASHSSPVPATASPLLSRSSRLTTQSPSSKQSPSRVGGKKSPIPAFSLSQFSKGFKRWGGPVRPQVLIAEPFAAEGNVFSRRSSHFNTTREFFHVTPKDNVTSSLDTATLHAKGLNIDPPANLKIPDIVNRTAVNWSTDTQYAITSRTYIPTNFTFLAAHPDACLAKIDGSPAVKGLILVPSGGSNVDKRNILRKRFLPKPPLLKRLFVVGVPVVKANTLTRCEISVEGCQLDGKLLAQLQEENKEHGDLIISLSVDTYQSLSVKTVLLFHWAVRYCPQAKVLFKMDDDVLPNMPYVAQILENFIEQAKSEARPKFLRSSTVKSFKTTPQANSSFFSKGQIAAWLPQDGSGTVLHRWMGTKMTYEALRSQAKTTVRIEEYPNGQYPYYASGPSYMISMDVVRKMSAIAQRVPFMPIEDAYVGILGHLLGLTILDYGSLMRGKCGPATITTHHNNKEEVLRKWEKCYGTTHLPLSV